MTSPLIANSLLWLAGFHTTMAPDVTMPMVTADMMKTMAAVVAPKPAGPHDWLIKHKTILDLIKLTNKERAEYGLPPVKLNTQMCLSAQKHAVWMAETGYYEHSALPWAEIIHHGPNSAKQAVIDWVWSPSHYAVMLSGSTEAGFGYMVIDGRTYWIGVFR